MVMDGGGFGLWRECGRGNVASWGDGSRGRVRKVCCGMLRDLQTSLNGR